MYIVYSLLAEYDQHISVHEPMTYTMCRKSHHVS